MGNELSQDGEGETGGGGPGPGPPRTVSAGAFPGSAAGGGATEGRGRGGMPPYMSPAISSALPSASPGNYPTPSEPGFPRRSASAGPITSAMPPPPPTAVSTGQQPGAPDIDLSNLSKEERDIIESVMARAQGMAPMSPTPQPYDQKAATSSASFQSQPANISDE